MPEFPASVVWLRFARPVVFPVASPGWIEGNPTPLGPQDVLKTRPDDVTNFIRGYFAAYDFWKANPAEADAIMADALGIPQAEFAASLAGLEFVSPADNAAYIGTPEALTQAVQRTARRASGLRDRL